MPPSPYGALSAPTPGLQPGAEHRSKALGSSASSFPPSGQQPSVPHLKSFHKTLVSVCRMTHSPRGMMQQDVGAPEVQHSSAQGVLSVSWGASSALTLSYWLLVLRDETPLLTTVTLTTASS